MIDLEFDPGLHSWSWARPAGPALSAGQELADGIVIEADIADPWILTGFTAPDGELARTVIMACLGDDARDVVFNRTSGPVVPGDENETVRTALGRWILAADELDRHHEDPTPLVLAGWIVDASIAALDAESALGIDLGLVHRYRQPMEEAFLALISSPGERVRVSDYLVRRISRAAERITKSDAGLGHRVEMLSTWLDPRHQPDERDQLPVTLALDLAPESMKVQAFRPRDDVIVHVDPVDSSVVDQKLADRAWRPDGTPIAFAAVRWTGLKPPGRAQLLVPVEERVELDITGEPQSPRNGVAMDAPARLVVPPGRRSAPNLAPVDSPHARAAEKGLNAAEAERLGRASAHHWAGVGRLWADLSDDDRAWLALEHALLLISPARRGGPSDLRQISDVAHRVEQQREEIETASASLAPSWANTRSEKRPALRTESFISDNLAAMVANRTRPV